MKFSLWFPIIRVTGTRQMETLVFILLLISAPKAFSQIDLTRYHNPRLPVLVMDDYMKPEFAWNMKGNLQALINEGINSLDEGNITIAIINLRKAVKIDSTLWMSRYYRGICYKQMGIFDSATFDFLSVINLNTKLAEPHIELAEIFIGTRKIKKAEQNLESAIIKNPALPQSYYNQAAIAIIEGNLNKARKLYRKANEVGPKYPDAYLMQGLLTDKFNSKDALELIGKAIEVDPSYSTGYFWRGWLLLKVDKIEECLKEWNSLIQYNPENPLYSLMRGYLYIELEQFDKAFIDLKNAMKAQEINENKFAGKQSVLDKRIDLHAALRYLIANGYGLDETSFIFLQKGFCMLLSRKEKAAIESFTHAENLQPSATVYFLKAIAFEHEGLHQNALEYYTRALKRDNDIFDAHKKRTVYRMELEDWEGVQADLNDMLRLEPKSPVAYRLRGLARARQKNYAEAITDFNRFLETDSADKEVNQTLITCYTLLGNREEAHRNMVNALEKDPVNWTLRNEMITNYLVLKDTVQALLIIDEYLKINMLFVDPYIRKAEICVQRKDFRSAEVLIEKIKKEASEEYAPHLYSNLYLWEGLIAYHNNDLKKAISKFDKSLKRNDNNLESQYWRAKAYEKTAQSEKAFESFRMLANLNYRDSKECYQAILKKL